MKRRIQGYRKYVDRLLGQENPDTDWERVREEHLIQVGFFQHERLIHLIVTVVFAVLTFLAVCMAYFLIAQGLEGAPSWLLLVAALMVLLVPYIGHYFTLENEVQRMYRQYDAIVARAGRPAFRLEADAGQTKK